MTKMTLMLLAMASMLSASLSAQKTAITPVRVYVFTATSESGFIDADSQGRADSVLDLKKQLEDKKKVMTVVTRPEEAEITIEVLGRSFGKTGDTSHYVDPVFGNAKTSADSEGNLRVKLAVEGYSTEIVGGSGPVKFGLWKETARVAAKEVEKWVKSNSARIPRKQP